MRTLVHECDWLSQRAYIAVLEQVADWQWGGLGESGAAGLTRVDSVARPWRCLSPAHGLPRRKVMPRRAGLPPLLATSRRHPWCRCRPAPVPGQGLINCAASVYADCSGEPVAVWSVPVADLSRNRVRISQALQAAARESDQSSNWFFLEGTHPDLLAAVIQREGFSPGRSWQRTHQRPWFLRIHPPRVIPNSGTALRAT